MKNIVVIWSSPNRDGLTASAAHSLIKGMEKGGASVEEVWLNGLDMQHCMACGTGYGACRSEGACVLADGFQELYDKLVKADGIAFVTAVYWHNVTEVMKAFTDRLRRCEASHNHFLAEKKAYIAACAGGTGNGATECLVTLENTLRHMGIKVWDRMPVTRFNRDYNVPSLERGGELFAERLETGFK
ncbi:MAG: flavodoxin family protein [Firmicutes bacterium]|nr:flavodoxin family protein [Bacillota bacterium]